MLVYLRHREIANRQACDMNPPDVAAVIESFMKTADQPRHAQSAERMASAEHLIKQTMHRIEREQPKKARRIDDRVGSTASIDLASSRESTSQGVDLLRGPTARLDATTPRREHDLEFLRQKVHNVTQERQELQERCSYLRAILFASLVCQGCERYLHKISISTTSLIEITDHSHVRSHCIWHVDSSSIPESLRTDDHPAFLAAHAFTFPNVSYDYEE